MDLEIITTFLGFERKSLKNPGGMGIYRFEIEPDFLPLTDNAQFQFVLLLHRKIQEARFDPGLLLIPIPIFCAVTRFSSIAQPCRMTHTGRHAGTHL
jgi:hypothetical protein